MTSSETVSAEGPSNKPRFSFGFVRCLGAMILGAASVAVFRWERVSIDQPGALPLLMLAGGLIVAGPPRKAPVPSRATTVGQVLITMALIWCIIGAFGFVEEKEAALLTFPNWSMVLGLAILGWCLRQTNRPFVLVAILAMGVCRLIASAFLGFHPESVWWTATLIWSAAVYLGSRQLPVGTTDSPPLIGGVFWFVLLVGSLTIQETRNPLSPFGGSDDRSAVNAVLAQPLAGFGSGSFDHVLHEFTIRSPEPGSRVLDGEERESRTRWGARTILRMMVEIGGPAIVLLFLGTVLTMASTIQSRAWTLERTVCFGAAAFWLAAILSMRTASPLAPAILAFVLPAALGRQNTAANDTEVKRRFAFEPWAAALLLLVAPAILFPYARWQWNRQNPETNVQAKSILGSWTEPLRMQAWCIRARSEEIAKYADPRDYLKPVVENWLAASPRDEMALIERVRLAERTDGRVAAEQAALDAHRRLPWSPAFTLWVVRMRLEQGRVDDAIEFLDELSRRQKPLHPAVRSRLVTLREQRVLSNNGS